IGRMIKLDRLKVDNGASIHINIYDGKGTSERWAFDRGGRGLVLCDTSKRCGLFPSNINSTDGHREGVLWGAVAILILRKVEYKTMISGLKYSWITYRIHYGHCVVSEVV